MSPSNETTVIPTLHAQPTRLWHLHLANAKQEEDTNTVFWPKKSALALRFIALHEPHIHKQNTRYIAQDLVTFARGLALYCAEQRRWGWRWKSWRAR